MKLVKKDRLIFICIAAIGGLSTPARAVDPTVAGNTSMGTHPTYGTAYSGFWRNGVDYSVLTDGNRLYLNAPNGNSTIFFRGNNWANNGVADPDGGQSRAYIDGNSNMHVGGTVYAGSGRPAFSLPSPGNEEPVVEGVATAGEGIHGESTWSFGVFGESDNNAAVGGYSVNNWAGRFGVDPHDDSVRPKYGVYGFGYKAAAQFDGNVTINPTLTPTSGNDIPTASTLTVNATTQFNGFVQISGNNLNLIGNGQSSGVAKKPGGGPWTSNSDIRVKKDVVDFNLGLSDLAKVRVVKYKYNGLGDTDNSNHEYVGVVAQELEQVLPFMVMTQPEKLRPTDDKPTDIKIVDPNAFTYMLINSIKELAAKSEEQNKKIAELTDQNKTLAQLAEQNKMLTAFVCRDHPAVNVCAQPVALAQ